MAFPTSPSNGAQATVNNIVYQYDSTKNAWSRISVDATNGNVSCYSVSATSSVTTVNIVKSGTSGVGDVGQTNNRFGTIYGVASSATYADLAERYLADQNYPHGHVVVFGGPYEITESTKSHDTAIAGVVSTSPAYLMNEADPDGLPIALQGRVPCKVKGPVKQGDLVVASDIPGVAQRLNQAQYLPGCVIGKALNSIEDNEIHSIEVVVGRL